MSALQLRPVNSDVYGVYAPTGAHVGNLKRVGPVWKFKAIGYDDDGSVVPGGGPLTDRHNTVFPEPDPALVNVMLDIS